jgi:ribulose kinase
MRWYSRLTLREPLTNKVAEQDILQRYVTLAHRRKWQERQDKYEELIKRNRKTVQSTSVQSTGVQGTGVQNTLCTQKSM